MKTQGIPTITLLPKLLRTKLKVKVTTAYLEPLIVSIRSQPTQVDHGQDSAAEFHCYNHCVDVIELSDGWIVRMRSDKDGNRKVTDNPAYEIDVVDSAIVEYSTCCC